MIKKGGKLIMKLQMRLMALVICIGLIYNPQLLLARKGDKVKEKKREVQLMQEIPYSDKVAVAMGDIKWGISHNELLNYFVQKIKEKYKPLLANTKGVIEKDRLLREMREEIKQLKDSYIEFKGQKTSWDVSIIADQYTHNNNEAMLYVKGEILGEEVNYSDYFFFINDRLWKRFRAFNQEAFEGITFQEFAERIQAMFGPAKLGFCVDRYGDKHLCELYWQDDNTKLVAIDRTEFYGVFCLVFIEKATEKNLANLRKNKPVKTTDLASSIISVLDEGERSADKSSGGNIPKKQGEQTVPNQQPATKDKKNSQTLDDLEL